MQVVLTELEEEDYTYQEHLTLENEVHMSEALGDLPDGRFKGISCLHPRVLRFLIHGQENTLGRYPRSLSRIERMAG